MPTVADVVDAARLLDPGQAVPVDLVRVRDRETKERQMPGLTARPDAGPSQRAIERALADGPCAFLGRYPSLRLVSHPSTGCSTLAPCRPQPCRQHRLQHARSLQAATLSLPIARREQLCRCLEPAQTVATTTSEP
jgi:hypothetical protein